MADVKFENAYKIYDKSIEAVKNLSFECRDKEFFAILGPSGCGKTSTLRMLAGLEDISEGNIYIAGKNVNNVASNNRNVAMSFENYGLYPHFTIFENIAYPLRIRKLAEQQVEEGVMAIAGKLRLLDILDSYPDSLSSGQKQRVSIARALVRNPDVTIMDEPLSHLDARMRSYIWGEIKHLHTTLGLTTIYVTHDQIEAMTMADKILIMNFGVEQQIGTPDEVYNEPGNLFVAGFIGTPQMNFIDGAIAEKDGVLYFEGGSGIELDMEDYRGLVSNGQPVTFGIRPHDIRLSEKRKDGYTQGAIYIVEPLGETTIINIELGGIKLRAEIDGAGGGWEADQRIWLSFDTDKSHLFDQRSGERIVI
jgi:multiple sugar transport system ATP-binding protein